MLISELWNCSGDNTVPH